MTKQEIQHKAESQQTAMMTMDQRWSLCMSQQPPIHFILTLILFVTLFNWKGTVHLYSSSINLQPHFNIFKHEIKKQYDQHDSN
jgi:uncharacterized membrane protein (DUF106 family)